VRGKTFVLREFPVSALMRPAFSGSFHSASRLASLGFGQDDTGKRAPRRPSVESENERIGPVNLRLVVSPSDIGHSEAAPRGGVKRSLKIEQIAIGN